VASEADAESMYEPAAHALQTRSFVAVAAAL
jgi:hypothetical protein